jgi:Predicted membrane protein (DUF2207)
LLELAALGLLPALLVLTGVWLFYGRERKTAYDREYEQEPPTDTAPALVPRLLAQGGTASSLEFTATLFDLIRRKVYKAEHVTTERSTWGGLHTEQLADLELSKGTRLESLAPWEKEVASVVDHVLDNGSERLSAFREKIEADTRRLLGWWRRRRRRWRRRLRLVGPRELVERDRAGRGDVERLGRTG